MSPSFASAPKPKSLFPLSEQQQAIMDCVANEHCHIVVNAGAGTGKTTTALASLDALSRDYNSASYLAFNSSIAKSTQAKIRPPFTSRTFHAAGYGAVRKLFPAATQGDPNPDRTWDMLPPTMPRSTRQLIVKMVSICKGQLCDGKDPEELLTLATQFDIDLSSKEQWDDTQDQVLEWVPVILDLSKNPTDCIDFDDMVWLAVVHARAVGPFLNRYDFLIIDESQDLNPAQQQLALQVGKRILVIGDRRQAIYAWRGADSKSMDTLRDILGSTSRGVKEFPLTVTRRCPVLVTALARTIVPDFEYPLEQLGTPQGKSGYVCFGSHYLSWIGPEYEYKTSKFPPVIHHEMLASQTQAWEEEGYCKDPKPQLGDLVLCRTNGPLISLAYELIRAQTPVKIQGRDIGQGLKTLVQKLVPNNATVDDLDLAVAQWYNKQVAKLARASETRAEQQMQLLQDKRDCIIALSDGLTFVTQVIQRIDTLFANVTEGADTSHYVLLSSVHRAKGLESHTVRIIEPQLMPHPMARTPEAREQEMNLLYVAYTRSLDTLHVH